MAARDNARREAEAARSLAQRIRDTTEGRVQADWVDESRRDFRSFWLDIMDVSREAGKYVRDGEFNRFCDERDDKRVAKSTKKLKRIRRGLVGGFHIVAKVDNRPLEDLEEDETTENNNEWLMEMHDCFILSNPSIPHEDSDFETPLEEVMLHEFVLEPEPLNVPCPAQHENEPDEA
jgi:hypothetical protein